MSKRGGPEGRSDLPAQPQSRRLRQQQYELERAMPEMYRTEPEGSPDCYAQPQPRRLQQRQYELERNPFPYASAYEDDPKVSRVMPRPTGHPPEDMRRDIRYEERSRHSYLEMEQELYMTATKYRGISQEQPQFTPEEYQGQENISRRYAQREMKRSEELLRGSTPQYTEDISAPPVGERPPVRPQTYEKDPYRAAVGQRSRARPPLHEDYPYDIQLGQGTLTRPMQYEKDPHMLQMEHKSFAQSHHHEQGYYQFQARQRPFTGSQLERSQRSPTRLQYERDPHDSSFDQASSLSAQKYVQCLYDLELSQKSTTVPQHYEQDSYELQLGQKSFVGSQEYGPFGRGDMDYTPSTRPQQCEQQPHDLEIGHRSSMRSHLYEQDPYAEQGGQRIPIARHQYEQVLREYDVPQEYHPATRRPEEKVYDQPRDKEPPTSPQHYEPEHRGPKMVQRSSMNSPNLDQNRSVAQRSRDSSVKSQQFEKKPRGQDSEIRGSQSKPVARKKSEKLVMKPQQQVQSTPESPSQASSSSTDDVVAPIIRNLEQLSVTKTERSPVIKRGELGKRIPLTANYIKLSVEPGKGMFEYHVFFNPEVDSNDIRFKLLRTLEDVIGKIRTFDGTTLYLPFLLKDELSELRTKHPITSAEQFVKLKFIRPRRLGECIHFYNVLLKRIMSELKLARIGRQHFDPTKAKIIPQHKLELWPGYVASVEEFEGGILLNCDSSTRLLRTENVLEFITYIGRSKKDQMEIFMEEVKKCLLGASVLTRYNNRTYRIDEVDFNMSPRDTFPVNGQEISFYQYYKTQYGLEIMSLDQPVLYSRMKVRLQGGQEKERLAVLIPELCYMTGITDEMRKDFTVMKDIATYSKVTPSQRHYALRQYITSVNSNEKAKSVLRDWGLRLDSGTLELEGRVAAGEYVFFGNNVKWEPNPNVDWTNTTVNHDTFFTIDLLSWALLYTNRDRRYAEDFSETIKRITPGMGMRVAVPHMYKVIDEKTDTYLRCLRSVVKPGLQLVVIIVPTPRDDRYAAIKKLCNVEKPIPSQVINSKTLSRPDRLRSIVQKIALQVNVKIGGSLWTIQNPFKNVMVIGVDSYHDSVNKTRSVGGFVCSLNNELTHYYSRACFQNQGQELMNSLKVCFIQGLEHYYARNQKFPDRIFIFRDGVGDGQLQTVRDFESQQFTSCFKDIDANYQPKFTMVVVQKRINTKVLAIQNGRVENPPPGTIVDHTVNRRYFYDFFLVSQSVRQGTVNPTHYVVVSDNSNIKPDHMQKFAYKMCHMYYNWMGTIRVPAQCQYAHKIAQHVGMHLKQEPHPSLADRLFYL